MKSDVKSDGGGEVEGTGSGSRLDVAVVLLKAQTSEEYMTYTVHHI